MAEGRSHVGEDAEEGCYGDGPLAGSNKEHVTGAEPGESQEPVNLDRSSEIFSPSTLRVEAQILGDTPWDS